jgi:ankyrin repeat protein
VTHDYSPLFLAAASGNLETIQELAPVADTPDLNKSLAQAAALSQFEAADALLAAGAEPDGDYDPLYGTVLFPACEFLNSDGISYLIKHGADPSREVLRIDGPRNCLTHLFHSHHRSSLKSRCIQLLLQAGAPDPQDAAMAIHLGSLPRLIKALDAQPKSLESPLNLPYGHHPLQGAGLLHMAVEFNQAELAKELLSRGLEVNQPAERIPGTTQTSPVWPTDLVALGGQTPLFHAKGSSREMLRFLLEEGADPDIPAYFLRDGKELTLTPLAFFKEIDRIECNLLEEILTLTPPHRPKKKHRT